MLEHIDQLTEASARAISNIKFDKIIVWDGGAGTAGGPGATAGFLQGLTRSLPPMLQIMKDVGGVQMPEFLGKLVGDAPKPADAAAVATPSPASPTTDAGKGGERS